MSTLQHDGVRAVISVFIATMATKLVRPQLEFICNFSAMYMYNVAQCSWSYNVM